MRDRREKMGEKTHSREKFSENIRGGSEREWRDGRMLKKGDLRRMNFGYK